MIRFYRPPVTSADCIIGTAKSPDTAISLNYDDDVFSQRFGQIKGAFTALTKNDIFKPYISDIDFRSTSNDNDIG